MQTGLAIWGWGVRRPKYLTSYYTSTRCLQGYMRRSLLWRHNRRNGVSNHQPHDCLLNRLFRRRSKKTSKPRISGLLRGIHRWLVNSPHKWPVMRKMFPFDDVIMCQGNFRELSGKFVPECGKPVSVPSSTVLGCRNGVTLAEISIPHL